MQPPGRYGAIGIHENQVTRFQEKPVGDGGWINGGYFVVEPSTIELIDSDDCVWEQEPLNTLARAAKCLFAQGLLAADGHPADRHKLEDLWASGNAPWKVWS